MERNLQDDDLEEFHTISETEERNDVKMGNHWPKKKLISRLSRRNATEKKSSNDKTKDPSNKSSWKTEKLASMLSSKKISSKFIK